MKAHLALFPGWQETLKTAKENPTIQNEVGGIKLLPGYTHPKSGRIHFQEGLVFVNGIPVELEYPLQGMHIWVSSNQLSDLIDEPFRFGDKISGFTAYSLVRKIVKEISPQDSLKLMNVHQFLWHKYTPKAESITVNCRNLLFDQLCRNVAKVPGLFQTSPKWFVTSGPEVLEHKTPDNPINYTDEVAEICYLESLGYDHVNDSFGVFGVPSVIKVINKLVAKKKIPASAIERNQLGEAIRHRKSIGHIRRGTLEEEN